jgi:hypothetical protein
MLLRVSLFRGSIVATNQRNFLAAVGASTRREVWPHPPTLSTSSEPQTTRSVISWTMLGGQLEKIKYVSTYLMAQWRPAIYSCKKTGLWLDPTAKGPRVQVH